MRGAIAQEKGDSDGWNLKYAAGGLIDLEFIAQHLQLVHAATRPDILDTSTARVFEREEDAMLQAKSVGYLKVGQSGLMVAAMLGRIGLTEALKSKVVLPDDDVVSELVAEGKIELGMVNIAQILTTSGVDLVGPLPPELQSYIVFAGGVSAKSKAPDAARELIRFLKGPAVPVIRAQGMEPG